MEINPKNGVGFLLFGMKQSHVETILGSPDRQFKDEDQNSIYLYNAEKLRLTFYEDEDFRLGYIVTSNPDALLFGTNVIGRNPKEVISELSGKNITDWETAEEDGIQTDFNEDNWLVFVSEFEAITKVEVGALLVNDDFVWKFKA